MSDGDCVKVAVRIRPLVPSETSRGCQNVIEKIAGSEQIVVGGGLSAGSGGRGNGAFTFNHVFVPEDSQMCLYDESVKSMIEKLFKGYNVTILAYGQTGSGKTHTMGTCFDGNFNEFMGVIPRAMRDIFTTIEEMTTHEFTVKCSFMELYQEQLYDLLSNTNREQSVVDIREDNARGIVIPGLTEVSVSSAEETTKCLIKGSSGRAVGATAMNAQSSRSHAIFTLTIHMMKNGKAEDTTTSRFHLVDLAGSERSKKTKATGDRFKEGVKINQGLLALGNVISALGSSQKDNYIGYRDSKLTRLLQDSLGGNSVTLMIACISPADYNLEETLSTLRYADRAKKIRNKPIVNQNPKNEEIGKLNAIIQKLRLELINKSAGGHGNGDADNYNDELINTRKENNILIEKNRLLHKQLEATFNDVANIEMRATLAESANERLEGEYAELKRTIVELHTTEFSKESCPAEFVLATNKIKSLVDKMDEVFKNNKQEMNDHIQSINNGSCVEDEDAHKSSEVQQKQDNFTSRQINFNNELRKLNKELALKEELHQKYIGNMSTLSRYEDENNSSEKIKDYEQMIYALEKEKDELCEKLKSAKKNATSAKLAEERRKKVRQLEQEISKYMRTNLQQAKLLQVKEKDTQKLTILNNEIQSMKAAKIKLLRAMRAENESFRQWKLNREKEMVQLKAKDRKRQHAMAVMETLHNKQNNVYKRKIEEANAINKRLKDMLDKQKNAQMHKKGNYAGKVEQVVNWLDHEIEMILSVVDAKQSIEHLMENRGVIAKRLEELKSDSDVDEAEIEAQEEELIMRNIQIADLQQKVIDSNIEEKTKNIVEQMQSLPELRAALKHMFSLVTDMRKICTVKENKLEDIKMTFETADDRLAELEKELEANNIQFTENLNAVERTYEEKISVLLHELNRAPVKNINGTVDDLSEKRYQIQQETLDKLDVLRAELDEYKRKYSQLMQEHTNRNHSYKMKLRKQNMYESFLVDSEDESYEYSEIIDVDDSVQDPDWKLTPRVNPDILHSKNSITNKSETNVQKDDSKDSRKRSSSTLKCTCKGNCSTKQCGCKRQSLVCNENCRCAESCVNKNLGSNDMRDSSSEHDPTEIENGIEHPQYKRTKLSFDADTTSPYPYSSKKRMPFYNNNQ